MEKDNKFTNENEIAKEIPLYKKENLTREEAYQLNYECILISNITSEQDMKRRMSEQGLSKTTLPAYSHRIEAIRRYLISSIKTEDPIYATNKFVSEAQTYTLSKMLGESSTEEEDKASLREEIENCISKNAGGKR